MRKHYLDNIRWVTVVTVAIYHVFFIFNHVIPDLGMPFRDVQYQDAILYLLYPWFMILLFIVSGMSARYALEHQTIKEFIRLRTRKLLVPSTIGLFVIGWVQGYISMSISGFFESGTDRLPAPVLYLIMVLSGTGVLWFVQMLWVFSMLLAVVSHFEKGKLYERTGKIPNIGILLLVVPVWLSGLVLNMPVVTVYRFGIYALAFFLGYFVFAHDEVIERISRWTYFYVCAAVALGIFYTVLHFGENYAEMPLMGSLLAVAYAWAAILAIFGCFKSWCDQTGRVSRFMIRRSWGIYVFHYLAMSAAAYLLRKYTALSEIPCYLITAIATFGGSLLLYEILSRIPVIRWCVLGIRKEKNKQA